MTLCWQGTGLQLQRRVAGNVWMPLNDANRLIRLTGSISLQLLINIQDITETALRRILIKNDAAWEPL